MGISFKISKRGTRVKPKPVNPKSNSTIEDDEHPVEISSIPSNNVLNGKHEDAVGLSGSSLSSGRHQISVDDEVSFILNLYPDGYTIGKPSENDSELHTGFQEGSKMLHPYDRTTEGFFSAIESGRLPGSILDDIPCKYIDGILTCEVHDYRRCRSDSRSSLPSSNGSATINKVNLKMSLENVVKDISLMADDSWTYGDLMEVESRILKALQPKLCLDPKPMLDRLCESPICVKLDLGLMGSRKRKLRQIPEDSITSINRLHGKKICVDRTPNNSSYRIGEHGPTSGDVMLQQVQDIVAAQGMGNQRNMHDSVLHTPGASHAGQDMPISSYADNMNSTVLGKMDDQEARLSYFTNLCKRAKLGGPDSVHHLGLQGYQLMQQQPNARGIANQDGLKLEKADSIMVKTDMPIMEAEGSFMDPRFQQKFQQQSLLRTANQQPGWNNLNHQVEKEFKKEEHYQKRKLIQSPRLSAGAIAQSPLTVKSTEVSCGSMGTPYGAASSAASLGQLHREKSAMAGNPAAVLSTSITSSANDSMQAQHQVQLGSKRRSNSLPKTQVISGIGSPASVNTMGGSMNASSPSVNTPQLIDQSMQDRFAKIERVAMRYQLNCKKNKADLYPRRPQTFSSKELQIRLANACNDEYAKDELSTSMSNSLHGGNMNFCKIRTITVQSQANMLPASVKTKLIMSEKPNGTVALHYGDLDAHVFYEVEDYLPILPNTHMADLLAMQFVAWMDREGYFIDDQVQLRPPRNPNLSNGQSNGSVVPTSDPASEMPMYPESVSGQQTTMEAKPNVSISPVSSTLDVLPSSGMLPPGNSQALQMSQSLMSGVTMPPRSQQTDPQLPLQPQQQPQQLPLQNQPLVSQQQPQFQRSPLMLPTNSGPQLNSFGPGSNLPLGNHMGNKASSLQLLQQQHQQQTQAQQTQPQMQRRMMMGLGPTMGMGNIGNNLVGLGGMGNVMGIGGARGITGAGLSAPMGPISGIGGNMSQNQINLSQANAISQHLRSGPLSSPQTQAALAQRLKFLHSRGILAGNQSGIGGMPGGARQMQQGSTGLSMLGQPLNRGNISPMQRTTMNPMGMARLMPGMNVPLSQQQQLQLQQNQLLQQQQQPPQQHQQQQLQQQQPQLQQQQMNQQQEANSPLQAVVLPQQMGSPSTLGIPQHMNQQQPSPQQMVQRTPMSPPLSSGPMHPMSTGNPDPCPASPALSSQTLGSVGSITNSPMDLQGVNKSNSVTNT
ncbi:protein PHYTOCHROME-DEPENDENT LATE-FLOWERING [Amaranthus tricolor]|uniref:protein PHYTOCHROME-DEPENDENT LATE-FLOWERING n=1 Tax=Amaranthus tricolor TaxID=29722 RepID=UPI00258FDF71|nr:protein PHYTOCHROME-DEPENDENT LATE-FLOWERING [Amaranthus tricolor]